MKTINIKNLIIALALVLIGMTNSYSQYILTVTKTSDPIPWLYSANPDDPEIQGTLQWAIRKANELGVPCQIVFDIPGSGQQIIYLNYELPFITTQVNIDATTQTGYQVTQPVIILDGQNILNTALQVNNQNNCSIKGLYIRNFTYHAIVLYQNTYTEITENVINKIQSTESNATVGIRLMSSNNNSIKGNIIGTDNSLSLGLGIGSYGIYNEYNSSNNTIGGTGLNENNTITNNGVRGIWIASGNGNKISGNKIFNNPIGILISEGGNNDKKTPVITSYSGTTITGTSEPNDIIEIFGSTGSENANEFLASTTSDVDGNWSTSISYNTLNYIIALSTDINGNTSKLSNVISSEIDYCLINPINVSYESTNITCYDSNDGSISLNISGGFSPYNLIWETNPIQTLNSITNLKAGLYKFEITDSHGCIKHDSITLTEPYKQAQIYEDLILNYSSSSSLSDVSNAVDKFDNFYVAGTTDDEILGKKITLLKYNNSGIEQWIRNFNVFSELKKIIIDKQNNVIVIGTKTENNLKSILATKYNQTGAILWSSIYNFSNNSDEIKDATIDNDNNIIIASNIDSYSKILIVKFDYSGNLLWATNYNDYPSKANSIVADGINIYITGSCINNFNNDFITICYSNSGIFLWSNLYNGSDNEFDEAISINIDNTSVYVTGKSFSSISDYDIITIKYNKTGTEQWVAKFNGVSNSVDIPSKIAVNKNIYITAKSNNEFNNTDFLTLCYDVNGQLIWGQFYNGASNDNDYPNDLKVTNTNVVISGVSSDFCTGSDYLTINYKTTGELDWVQRFSSEGNNTDFSNSISIDNNLNVFVSGLSTNKFGNYDITTVKYKNIETLCLSFPNKLKNKEDLQTENMSRNFFMLVNSFMYIAQSKELLNTVYNEAKKSEDFEVRYNTLIQKNPQFKTLIEKQLNKCFYADKPNITEPYKDIESNLIYDNDLYVPNIYIPNINIADLNNLPIIAIGTSEVNDNDEIVGYALSKNGQVKEILISEEFAKSSKIPIIIFNNASDKIIKITNIITDTISFSKNILATKQYVTNYSIKYRYECNSKSDYHYQPLAFKQGYNQVYSDYLIRRIHKSNLNKVYYDYAEIWQLSGISTLYAFAVVNYEHDWNASRKGVIINENSSLLANPPCIVECKMSNNGDWYQAIYFPLTMSSYTSTSKGGCKIVKQ